MKLLFKRSFITVSLTLAAVFMLTSAQKHKGRDSFIDRLFVEAQDENADLKKLMADWDKLREDGQEKKRQLQQKIVDIETYYREANSEAASIQDGTLKMKAGKMVNEAEAIFKKTAEPLKQQIAELEKQERLMADHESLLKIKYTLPKIKAMENKLTADELKAIIKSYGDLVSRAGKMGE